MKSLRIAYVMAGTGMGGLQKHTLELSEEIYSRGHSVALFANKYFNKYVPGGVEHIYLNLERNRYNPFLLFEIWLKLKKFNPDIIHAQASKSAALISFLSRRFENICTVVTVHNQKSNLKVFKSFDARIAVCKKIQNQLLPLSSNVIYNGIRSIPLQKPNLIPWDGLSKGPRILAVGRLVSAKAFDVLIEAWEKVDAPIVIAGSGPEKARLLKIIKKKQLENKVRLLGHREDVYNLMQSADLLVISSKKEGGPIVMLEALQVGLPVISTTVGMVTEFIPTEFVCKRLDAKSFANCINNSLYDLNSTKDKFKTICSEIRSKMTLSRMADDTLALYMNCIENKSKHST